MRLLSVLREKISEAFLNNKALFFILLLLIIFLPIIVFISTRDDLRDNQIRATGESVDALTQRAIENNRIGRYGSNNLILEKRKEQMYSLSYENPKEFLSRVLDDSELKSFPIGQRGLLEENIKLSGLLISAHIENFDEMTEEVEYFIQVGNELYGLSFDEPISEEDLKLNSRVSLTGYRIEDNVVVKKSDLHVESVEESRTVFLRSSQSKKYFVWPVNFSDHRKRSYTKKQINRRIFCSPDCNDSASRYYSVISNRRLSIGGLVADWWQTNLTKKEACTREGRHKLLNRAKKRRPNVFKSYDGVIFVYPKETFCGWSGVATLGGRPSVSWISDFTIRTLVHELGHNLGVHHASLLRCDIEPFCTNTIEIGDLSDPMGFYLSKMNGSHLRALGFRSDEILRNITEDGVYRVNRLYSNSSPRILKINIPENDSDIYIEYRGEKTGYDRGGAYNLDDGILVYLWDGRKNSRTYLVKFSSSQTPVFKDGDVFSILGYEIEQVSHNNNFALVKIAKQTD